MDKIGTSFNLNVSDYIDHNSSLIQLHTDSTFLHVDQPNLQPYYTLHITGLMYPTSISFSILHITNYRLLSTTKMQAYYNISILTQAPAASLKHSSTSCIYSWALEHRKD